MWASAGYISLFSLHFIRLLIILKFRNLKAVRDFRRISLIGCQYKIICKLLANRLEEVIVSVVSMNQSAFIKGRHILDGLFILNEIVAWSRVSKNQPLIFKVGFEKSMTLFIESIFWIL